MLHQHVPAGTRPAKQSPRKRIVQIRRVVNVLEDAKAGHKIVFISVMLDVTELGMPC